MRRPLTHLGVALAIAAGAGAAYGQITRTGAGQSPSGSPSAPVNRTLHLRGHVRGLYPGSHRRLTVAIRSRGQNPPVVVRSVKARVRSASAGCPTSSLRIRSFRGSKPIDGGHLGRVRLRARMSRSAPETCQGARFRLRYRAWAVVGGGP